MSFGVALGAHVTGAWQVGKHLRQSHLLLTLQAARLLLGPLLALARPAALALRRGRRLWLRRRFLAAFDRRRIAREVPDQMILHGVIEQRLVQAAWQGAVGELGERTREGRLAGDRPRTLLQPHRRRSVQSLASRSMSARVVVMSNTALAMKGARYGRTVVLRPASQLQGWQQALNPYELDDPHQRLVALPQGTEVLLKRRKQLRLKGTPVAR